MPNITYTSAFDSDIITPELIIKLSKVCCLQCGSKDIDLDAKLYITNGILLIYYIGNDCPKCYK